MVSAEMPITNVDSGFTQLTASQSVFVVNPAQGTGSDSSCKYGKALRVSQILVHVFWSSYYYRIPRLASPAAPCPLWT